jgi:uncharacterized surface protein with fasciclin (FAS1) repeats
MKNSTKIATLAMASMVALGGVNLANAGSCPGQAKAKDHAGTYHNWQKAEKASATDKASIVETAVAAGDFKVLVAAVKAAGLVETLSGEGPFTVFAPTDEAFERLPDGTIEALLEDTEKLAAILTYHVVPGAVTASEVVGLESAETVNGQAVKIRTRGEKVFVDDAKVVTTDILCENGVIHVIDRVILPN